MQVKPAGRNFNRVSPTMVNVWILRVALESDQESCARCVHLSGSEQRHRLKSTSREARSGQTLSALVVFFTNMSQTDVE